MIDPNDFMTHVIVPTLHRLRTADERLSSLAAAQLLLGTAIMESRLTYLAQRGGGPAQGFFQIEPATLNDTYRRYLYENRPDLKRVVDGLVLPGMTLDTQLAGNAHFGCAIARVKFWMSPLPMPEADDIDGLGAYWKEIYNTHLGAGTGPEWALNYRRYVKF